MTLLSGNHPDGAIPELRNPFDQPHFCCEGAQRFSAWIDSLVAALTRQGTTQPTLEQLQVAKALLVDEYRKERNGATKAHRDRLLDARGDPCLYGVFIATLERLAEIAIDPKIPPKPPPPRTSPSKRQQHQQQAQRFYGLPAFEIVPDEP